MKYYALIATLFPLICFAEVTHVGNGGGEAEMRILQMVPSVSLWAKACNDNPGACGSNVVFSKSDFEGLSQKVGFAPAKSSTQWCTREQTTLPHESLYTNNTVRKTDVQLASQLIGRLLSCAGWDKTKLEPLRMEILPLARRVSSTLPLFVMPGNITDVVVFEASSERAHLKLKQALRCSSYRFVSSEANGFKVRCENGNHFLVQPSYRNNSLQFLARYDGAE